MKHVITGLVFPMAVLASCSRNPDLTAAPVTTPPAGVSAEIQKAAVQRGKAIVAETFSLLSSNLQSAIQQSGVSNALPFCSLAASPLTAGMASKHRVSIRRVTHKPRNPAGRADATELAVLKRFETAIAGTKLPSPLVIKLTANTVTFFDPIVLNNELCLKCHGEPGADISAENTAVIQRLYPRDEATGFKLGDLRGAWRIDFPLAALAAGP